MVSLAPSCNTNSNSEYKLQLDYPNHFPDPIPSPIRNKLTQERVALGQSLFFDPLLSSTGNISCATCHNPNLSFSDGKKFSLGHSGLPLKRNTPALINLAWSEHFFWDGGVKNLESLSFAALLNPDEMAIDLTQLCRELNQHPTYPDRFKKAYKTDSVSSAFISRALAQYMRTLISSSSKYDSVMQGHTTFTHLENQGYQIFMSNCATCHKPPLFQDNLFHHNGLSQTYSAEDLYLSTGRFRITRDSADLGKYKTPTLRNLNSTFPYMHDGRFESIDEVLNHYQSIDSANENQDLLVRSISFSEDDKQAIKAFLETLNDQPDN
ncbi:MAG: cytochrome c peroxidase [Reichenbachiella sp.]|uniref:cytochrome-c peroxidase n=1 Tax=Reichenbachiella sp. TaxID=2184521 RepID=UPI003265724B